MAIFQRFMFHALPALTSPDEISDEAKPPVLEELPSTAGEEVPTPRKDQIENIPPKEKLIVVFLYLLMGSFGILLLVYLVLIILEHPNANEVFNFLMYVTTTLVGFFLGVNKNRPTEGV